LKSSPSSPLRLISLLLAGLLFLPATGAAEEAVADPLITVDFARTELSGGVYQLHGGIRYRLSPVLADALHNGVALVFEVQVQIERERAWIWDSTVATITQRYRIEYHALSQLYLLTHLNTGVQKSFFRLSSLLGTMGELDRIPLLDAALLDGDSGYKAHMRARLAVDALPLPLRLRAHLSPEWSPVSDWYTWSLR